MEHDCNGSVIISASSENFEDPTRKSQADLP